MSTTTTTTFPTTTDEASTSYAAKVAATVTRDGDIAYSMRASCATDPGMARCIYCRSVRLCALATARDLGIELHERDQLW
jgi:hypothetical protein